MKENITPNVEKMIGIHSEKSFKSFKKEKEKKKTFKKELHKVPSRIKSL